MQTVFVDTSAWVALFVANDTNHVRASSIFDKLKTKKARLFTSDYIVDETITTIMARGGHRQSVIAGNALLTSKIVKIAYVSPGHFRAAWERYQKYGDQSFSFTDVTSFVIMEGLGIKKAFSFDHDFAKVNIDVL